VALAVSVGKATPQMRKSTNIMMKPTFCMRRRPYLLIRAVCWQQAAAERHVRAVRQAGGSQTNKNRDIYAGQCGD
jgi:hypothetical protein